MTWHYLDGADQKGPISDAELAALVTSGKINDATLIWRDGMAQWEPYSQVRPSIPGAPPAVPSAAAPVIASGAVACAECGRVLSPSEVIRHGDVFICAACKPVFLQKLREGIAPTGRLNYAGFGVRGGSIILDGIILYIVILPISLLAPKYLGQTGALVGFFINTAVAISYYTFFLGKFGATPGKMANKLRVVNPDGSSIGYGKAFGRYFASNYVSGLFTLFIGYLMAIWDDEKRALHDRICSTRVIRAPRT